MNRIDFQRLEPDDLFEIDPQDSQTIVLGASAEIDMQTAELVAAQPEAWTAWVAGRPIACFGVSETFPGAHGVAWALLAAGIGAHHLAVTRFVRDRLAEIALPRIEVLARAAEVEWICDQFPGLDQFTLVAAAMAEPTPECRWAKLLGFDAVHVLRRFGAGDETYMLFERILPRASTAKERLAA